MPSSLDMDDSRLLRGIELRYALTMYLAQHGQCTIATLIDALAHQGFVFGENPPACDGASGAGTPDSREGGQVAGLSPQ